MICYFVVDIWAGYWFCGV